MHLLHTEQTNQFITMVLHILLYGASTNVRPDTDTTKWNIIGRCRRWSDKFNGNTDISPSVSDNAILVYQNSSSRWKDRTPFGTTYGDISINGGIV